MNDKNKNITANLERKLLHDLEVLSSKLNKSKSGILVEALVLYKDRNTLVKENDKTIYLNLK